MSTRARIELDLEHLAAPEPPFCCATVVRPYKHRSTDPITIDYHDLTAFAHGARETLATEDVAAQLAREPRLDSPILIEATGAAEQERGAGAAALDYCIAHSLEAVLLVSADGSLPDSLPRCDAVVAVATWPGLDATLDPIFAQASRLGCDWGVIVPVVLTVTTELSVIGNIAARAAAAGASFLAALPIDLDPTAKRQIASVAISSEEEGEDAYSALFGDELEPLVVATERHIAALAIEHGMRDWVVLPSEERRDNWRAATLLARIAQRMFRMERDIELAWSIHRSAKVIAALGKSLTLIAASAPLSIIEGLDEASLDILGEWLATGTTNFGDAIDHAWRLRRDIYR